MKERRNRQTLLIGTVLMTVSLSAAWTAGRMSVQVEPPPMERFIESAEAPALATSVVAWDLPVTRNEHVERWVGFLKGGNRDRTQLWLERKGRYEGMIRSELRSRGMPEDLIYLVLIESGFSPKAYSRAAASGMWQFIAETGRRYGLEVSAEVDERRDPIRSTTAALDYLQELYDRFGSWYLAAAAYNTGENRVERILRERAGGARGHDSLFWKIAPHLPRETRDYVPLMLAAGHIGKEPEKYGFSNLKYHDPLAYETVWVPGSTPLSMIAKASGVTEAAVADLNPHLMRGRTPANRGWSVRIPVGTHVAFDTTFPALYRSARLAAAEEPAGESKATAAATHRIRRGDTLDRIAQRYGVTVAALRGANGNVHPRRLQPGHTLRVPGGSTASAPAARTAVKIANRYHRVASGDNLTKIAKRYGVTVTQIKRWNGLSGSRIRPGQRLRVSA